MAAAAESYSKDSEREQLFSAVTVRLTSGAVIVARSSAHTDCATGHACHSPSELQNVLLTSGSNLQGPTAMPAFNSAGFNTSTFVYPDTDHGHDVFYNEYQDIEVRKYRISTALACFCGNMQNACIIAMQLDKLTRFCVQRMASGRRTARHSRRIPLAHSTSFTR
jgi:hypothetical protein